MAAFDRAIVDGATAVETDLRLAADGRVVLLHDRTVDRTTDGSGDVALLNLDQLRQLDAGSWFAPGFTGEQVPTLEQVVERVLPRVPCVLQAKTASVASSIPQLIPGRLRPRVTVSSNRLSTLRSLAGEGLHRTWLTWWRDWPGWTAWVIRLAARAGIDRLAPMAATVTPRMVTRVHSAGLMVRAWGVGNDLQLAHRLLAMNVDGMTFDDPGRLRALIEGKAAASP